eukprot:495748-Amphidinium_carterae.2
MFPTTILVAKRYNWESCGANSSDMQGGTDALAGCTRGGLCILPVQAEELPKQNRTDSKWGVWLFP